MRKNLPEKITLAHGSGGRLTRELIELLFLRNFSNPALARLEDSAEVALGRERAAFTTDSYVVSPLEFPGADIGRIAVCGTVNDLAVKGARPLAISAGFIIEEGFNALRLSKIVRSMKAAAAEAGTPIVTGDTKVVEKGHADGLFINTSGIGLIPRGVNLSCKKIKPGDAVIVSGTLGDHGIAVMNARNSLGFSSAIRSDGAPLNAMLAGVLRAAPGGVRLMRDLTRGGLATALCEISDASGLSVEIDETVVPVATATGNACRMLGLDPLYVANEGKAVIFAAAADAAGILSSLRKNKYGRKAVVAGRVVREAKPQVRLNTAIGGSRIILPLEGEQLPRIC
ncbi:MAG TPA: hydrogenase expression/formation protein HypE [Elusimicrobia bacterium]|nr:hydrogenase expression/formation protein HypE [Elusimicrobiota bacterium]